MIDKILFYVRTNDNQMWIKYIDIMVCRTLTPVRTGLYMNMCTKIWKSSQMGLQEQTFEKSKWNRMISFQENALKCDRL